MILAILLVIVPCILLYAILISLAVHWFRGGRKGFALFYTEDETETYKNIDILPVRIFSVIWAILPFVVLATDLSMTKAIDISAFVSDDVLLGTTGATYFFLIIICGATMTNNEALEKLGSKERKVFLWLIVPLVFYTGFIHAITILAIADPGFEMTRRLI